MIYNLWSIRVGVPSAAIHTGCLQPVCETTASRWLAPLSLLRKHEMHAGAAPHLR